MYVDRFAGSDKHPADCHLYFFDQGGPEWALKDRATEGTWNSWNVKKKKWVPVNGSPPKPSGLYAGIGATCLTDEAEKAIHELYAEQ